MGWLFYCCSSGSLRHRETQSIYITSPFIIYIISNFYTYVKPVGAGFVKRFFLHNVICGESITTFCPGKVWIMGAYAAARWGPIGEDLVEWLLLFRVSGVYGPGPVGNGLDFHMLWRGTVGKTGRLPVVGPLTFWENDRQNLAAASHAKISEALQQRKNVLCRRAQHAHYNTRSPSCQVLLCTFFIHKKGRGVAPLPLFTF